MIYILIGLIFMLVLFSILIISSKCSRYEEMEESKNEFRKRI